MSQRGQGFCPQCKVIYFNRYKPERCKSCNFHIGGSYVSKAAKKPKLDAPSCVKLFTSENCAFFSAKTHAKNSRCILLIDAGSSKQCLNEKCKLARAAFVNSGREDLFSCEHSDQCESAQSPLAIHNLTADLITSYPSDDPTKETLTQIMRNSTSFPSVIYLSPSSYCVYGPPTSSNPVGFCHISISEGKIMCSSTDCKGYFSATKQQKQKKICVHIHVLLCVLPSLSSTGTPSSSPDCHPSTSAADLPPDENSSRTSTIKLNMLNTIPYVIPSTVLEQVAMQDSRSVVNHHDHPGWPSSFAPNCDHCRLCGSALGEPRSHPGQKQGEMGYIITNVVPFTPVKILVKFCVNASCKAMHQVFPFEIGLFNISDKLLVSFDILLEWREEFKRGVPLTVAIESKLGILVQKSKQPPQCLDYVTDLLYNGFYCFEVITERKLDDQICGICGIVGEIYLGDGNQKNCCSRKEICYDIDPQHQYDGHPMSLDKFFDKLRYQWVERNSFTRSKDPFSVHASEIPPIIAPKCAGEVVWNTELNKKSQFLKKVNKKVEGDPALLHAQIRDCGLEMASIDGLDLPQLMTLCAKCGVSDVSKKSQQRLRGDLQELYATLLVGDCPCHGFTQVPGHTGGFYHMVCRHGTTVASKFLVLQESVRDAADLYLSLKYPPPLFICDTPCGFARHMDCRTPVVANKLWERFSGCFEVPSCGEAPMEGVSVPSIVPAEYVPFRDATLGASQFEGTWDHPITGSSRRYVLGDRFHSASNPHKSPMCSFHDINLCLQANAIKTSYQESENNRKNMRRLRSSCVQGFGVHYLYNFLMDFYQNEQIVQKQLRILRKSLKQGWQIERDQYMRFIYVKCPKVSPTLV